MLKCLTFILLFTEGFRCERKQQNICVSVRLLARERFAGVHTSVFFEEFVDHLLYLWDVVRDLVPPERLVPAVAEELARELSGKVLVIVL